MRTQKLNKLQKIQNSFGRRENETCLRATAVHEAEGISLRVQRSNLTAQRHRQAFHATPCGIPLRGASRFPFSRFLPVFLFGLVVLLTLSSLSATFAELIPITLKHDGLFHSVAFSPDGTLLATGAWAPDSTARVWKMPSGKLLATLNHDGAVLSVAFSPDGRFLATGSNDFTAGVWEMPSGKLLATLNHDGAVSEVAFSPDGTLLATGSTDETAGVWEIPSGKLLATLKHSDDIRSVAFKPDGTLLATGSQDNTAKVWEIPSGKLLATLNHDDWVGSVAFSPDGMLLATGSSDGTTGVWEMPSGKQLLTLRHARDVLCVAFSPDGTLLATGSYDDTAKAWEMPSGKQLLTLKHADGVARIAFNPDGTLLATGSYDDTAKVWEIPSGKLLATLKHDDNIKIVIFSPDGTLLVTGAWRDNTANVWTPNTNDTPALTAPPDGSKFAVDALPELKWEKVPNALYQVQVATDKNFSQVAIEASTDTESLKVGMEHPALGMYFWRVRNIGWSDFGDWSTPWSFTISILPPVLASPRDGATFTDTLTPTLEWQAPLGAESYSIQIAKDEEFTILVVEEAQLPQPQFNVPWGNMENGNTYYWRVNVSKAIGTSDWSDAWSFTLELEREPPSAFDLQSPDNGVWTDATPTFVWSESRDTGLGLAHYQLWMDGKLLQDLISKISFTLTEAQALSSGFHTWTVKAVDNAANLTQANQTWTVRVDANAPEPFALLTPEQDYWTSNTRPVFEWQGSTDAETGLSKYQLYINNSLREDNISPDSNSIELSRTLSSGDYSWYVIAVDEVGYKTQSVQTRTIHIDTTPPTVPALSLPADRQWTPNTTPEFQWRVSTDAGIGLEEYQLWLDGALLYDDLAEFNLVEPTDRTWLFSKHPTFQWEATDDAETEIAEYHLIVDGKLARTTTKTSDAPDFELAVGEHTWMVNAIDQAGNARASSDVWRFSIDDTAPVCLITAPTQRVTISDRFYLIQGMTTDGVGLNVSGVASVELSINDGDWQPAQSTDSGFSSWTYGWEGFEEGMYIIRARATDRAGNVSPPSEPALVTVDFSSPGIESITVTPELAKPGDTVNVTLTFSATAELDYAVPPAVILMAADGTPIVATQESYKDGTWVGSIPITANVGDGIATIHVSQVVDVEGRQMFENPSAGRLAIDTTPPIVQAVSVSPELAKAGPIFVRVMFADTASGLDTSISPTVAFIPTGGDAIPLTQMDYDVLTQTWTGEAEVTADMNDGLAVITVENAVDRAGNQMPLNDAAGEFTIDVSPPVEFELVSPADDSWLKGDSVTFTWSASSDETSGLTSYRLYLNGSLHQSEIPADQTSVAADSPLLEGAYMWKIEAVDIAGNTQTSTSTFRFSVDNSSPQTTLTVGEPKSIEEENILMQSITQLTLTADDGAGSGVASIEYQLDDGEWIAYTKPFTVSSGGDHIIRYRSSDEVGNVETEQSVSIRVEVVTTWDVNGDGLVDVNDLLLVGQQFGETIVDPVPPNPDVNGDGVVDISDLALIGVHLGESVEASPEEQ